MDITFASSCRVDAGHTVLWGKAEAQAPQSDEPHVADVAQSGYFFYDSGRSSGPQVDSRLGHASRSSAFNTLGGRSAFRATDRRVMRFGWWPVHRQTRLNSVGRFPRVPMSSAVGDFALPGLPAANDFPDCHLENVARQ
jgi:hypothetical protein